MRPPFHAYYYPNNVESIEGSEVVVLFDKPSKRFSNYEGMIYYD